MTVGDGDVRITLTNVFERLEKQGTEVKDTLSEIKTSLAVLTESVKPQAGINTELFRRLHAVEKKVWAYPSAAVIIGLISLAVAMFRK